jgi:ERCC4-type nuclease
MKITYPGPSVGVDLLGPDDRMIRVMRGKSIEVPDEYGQQMLLQGWKGGNKDETNQARLVSAVPGLSEKAAEALVNAGYNDTASLAEASDDELRSVKGVGDASVEAIRAAVPATGAE